MISDFASASIAARGIVSRFSSAPIMCPIPLDHDGAFGPDWKSNFGSVGKLVASQSAIENNRAGLAKMTFRNWRPASWTLRAAAQVTATAIGWGTHPGLVAADDQNFIDVAEEIINCVIPQSTAGANVVQPDFTSRINPRPGGGRMTFQGVVGAATTFYPLYLIGGDVYGAYCVILAHLEVELTPWIYDLPTGGTYYCAQSCVYTLSTTIAADPLGSPLPDDATPFEGTEPPQGGCALSSVFELGPTPEIRASLLIGADATKDPGEATPERYMPWFAIPMAGDITNAVTFLHTEAAILKDYVPRAGF